MARRSSTTIAIACFALAFASTAACGARDALGATTSAAGDRAPEPRDHAADEDPREALRVGAIGGIGFPRPLSIEALVKIEDALAIGAEYGVMPTTTIGGVDTSLTSFAGDLRVFPFRGAFFVGLRAGRQHVSGDATVTVASVGSVSGSMAVDSWFVNPRVGFLWTFRSGLSIGVEAGVQLPVSSEVSSTLPAAIASAQPVASVTDALGKSPLPTIDLLRVGFLF